MTAPWRPAPGRVVCVGETMAALAPDPPRPLAEAERLRLSTAGAESNVAMYLADHGIPAVWLSAVGDDPLGHRVRAAVAAAGVDVSHVRTDPRLGLAEAEVELHLETRGHEHCQAVLAALHAAGHTLLGPEPAAKG